MEVITIVIISREGEKLKNHGAGGGSHISGRDDSWCRKGGIWIHVREGVAVTEGDGRLINFVEVSATRTTMQKVLTGGLGA
jgi:hypothetical protein